MGDLKNVYLQLAGQYQQVLNTIKRQIFLVALLRVMVFAVLIFLTYFFVKTQHQYSIYVLLLTIILFEVWLFC